MHTPRAQQTHKNINAYLRAPYLICTVNNPRRDPPSEGSAYEHIPFELDSPLLPLAFLVIIILA